MWTFAQLGSRDHYLYAKALHRQKQLDHLVTDIAFGGHETSYRILRRLPVTRRAVSRQVTWLQPEKIRAQSLVGLCNLLKLQVASRISKRGFWIAHVANAKAMGRRAAKEVERRAREGAPTHFMGYCSESAEAIAAAHRHGKKAIVIQYDGGRTADDIYAREAGIFPEWCKSNMRWPTRWLDRIEREWAAADHVICNSSWVRDAVISRGIAPEKVSVVPLAFEVAEPKANGAKRAKGDPLRFLWVGSVSTNKGFHYAAEAFRQCRQRGLNCDFEVIGSIDINPAKQREYMSQITFRGPQPKPDVLDAYRRADVFLFPTMADGFGMTQLEAQSNGMPVIASQRCGEVVVDGVTGWTLAEVTTDSLFNLMSQVASNPEQVWRMRAACEARSRDFSHQAFDLNLRGVIDRVLQIQK